MAKKILCLFYRPPIKNGIQCAFGQELFLRVMKKNFTVKIITFNKINKKSGNVTFVKLKSSIVRKIFFFLTFLKSPRLTHYLSREFLSEFKNAILEFKPDYIYAEHIFMMQYLLRVKSDFGKIYFNDESCLFINKYNLRKSFIEKMRNINIAKYEYKACNNSDLIITITEEEKIYLKKLRLDNTENIPYGINTKHFYYNWKSDLKEIKILYVGDYNHYPNREAVNIIVNKIFPELKENISNLKFIIVGRNTNKLKIKADKNVFIFENVEDVRIYYWSCTCMVVPVFSGSGLRIKVLEAASCGIPLVISPLANFDIHFKHNEEALIAGTIEEFIKAVKLLTNECDITDIVTLSQKARRIIELRYSEEVVSNKLENILDKYT